jgi:hypothetical protein
VSPQSGVFSTIIRYLASFFEIGKFGVKLLAFIFCQAMLSVIETTGAAYGSQKEDPQAIGEASSRAACV